ncbi:MAG: penicillin-binding protein 2 [Alphaproteobacteria bacterium]|nr:penicillin-binding protein 2 [Alphaproteobacteria bacterium]
MTKNATPEISGDRAERVYHTRCRTRFRLACLGFAVAFLLIGGRLVALGFTEDEKSSRGFMDISTTVHRPDIFDRHGQLLATDIRGATLYADPKRVIDSDELIEKVTSVLRDVNAADLRARLKAGKRFVRIKRELTPKQQAEIYALGQPGLGFIEEYRRVYPMNATTSHIVGLVDVDNRGLAGIEKFIDDNPQLAMAAAGAGVGEGVTLSIDLGVQYVLRQELKAAMDAYHAKAAASIVMDVHSGEVLGLVSLPDFDPHKREQALDKERVNRIGSGVYEMGSVFKMFTVAGVLDSGLANMHSSYDASSPIRYGRFTISDFHGKKRRLSVPEVFIYSSNIGAAKMAMHMGTDQYRGFLRKLGLLGRATTELGDSAAPIVPHNWQKLNTITIAFGHGLSVTPLQMASASVPLFNGGLGVTPTFLRRSREDAASVAPRVLKPQTSASMLQLMRLNVLKGTAKRAEAEGYRVGGKTGTAEKVVGGRYSRSALLTNFVAAFPTDAPEYLVLVMLDEPQRVAASNNAATAGVNAAPTAGKIIARIAPILGVAPKLQDDQHEFDAKVVASY